jgi:HD-like signal output (HDOD) protein/CheY-like chemotaxis protein
MFVDDEPLVLQGLRNSLRSKRKEWEMLFMDGAASALTEMERSPVDVIVSDMRMPCIDGAEFLALAAKVCPGATRIILSGQLEEGAVARAAVTAHRFLTKPCDQATLAASISRALELRDLLAIDRIRSCIGGVEMLPAIPGVYRELSSVLANEDASLETVTRVIERDVGISAKVLQLVNSAFFGVPMRTTSLQTAVRYLGVSTIRGLVLSYSVFEQFGAGGKAAAGLVHDHALRCARITRLLPLDKPRAEPAFTAALLHDVGMMVLGTKLAVEYAEIEAEAIEREMPIQCVEHERLGVSHAQVGAYLLGLWDLPAEVVEIVAFHHAPWTPTPQLDAGGAVRVASAIADELEGGAKGHCEELPDGWLDTLNLRAVLARAKALEIK